MTQPPQTPAQLGYRMPAEWHTHAATWLAWPKDPLTWPERVPQAEEIFLQMIRALAPHEIVNVLVDDEATRQAVLKRCGFPSKENVRFHFIETVDSWIRDYGPNFLLNEHGALAYNDWIFNAWGDKYEDLKRDNQIPTVLQSTLQHATRFQPNMVLEGGSIDVNGAGIVMTTEQCLLNPNRNPHLSRGEIEQRLRDYLGVEKILWLGEGIVGDDTDGHIDDIARFVSPTTIVCAMEDDPTDENYKLLFDNYQRLQRATDTRGQHYNIIPLPMPGHIGGREGRLPASYANFYIANRVVLVPIYNHMNDTRALETLRPLFPTHQLIPINCEPLVWGMGAIHCVTQQQPTSATTQETFRS